MDRCLKLTFFFCWLILPVVAQNRTPLAGDDPSGKTARKEKVSVAMPDGLARV